MTTKSATVELRPLAADDGLPAPAAPAPTLAGLLETLFVGFQRTFFNQTPTLAYNPSENQIVDGRTVGALHPADPDSEAVTVTATQPAFGTVDVHADGTFTYTPGPNYPGHDTFDVTVSDADNGFHIHGFSGLLNLLTFGLLGSAGHTTTATVDIGFERTPVVSGLNNPVDFRFLPDGRIVIGEQGGAIRVVKNGVLQSQPLIVLSAGTGGERGISGLAVDPNFGTNGFLYVAYTSAENRDRLSRITVTGDTAASETVLLETEPAGFIHHGGALGFGPDNKLYWGIGDNGIGANAQDLQTLRGKILRLNTDGSAPSDNPFFGHTDARPEIYAYGLRNPFRLTFTPGNQLLVADVGQVSWEEVNLVEAGKNYGWPSAEGVCNSCTSVNPIFTYPHGNGAAITSVLVYTGDTFDPSYLNKVFIADEVQGWIKVLSCAADFSSCSEVQTFDAHAGTTVKLAQGPDGNLYHLTYQPGELVRISPTGGSTPIQV
ncbi:PQQ-dependent sugar dehydrogenase [Mycobacterium sp. MMS18-G62]